jgi:hypothetical protein
LDELCNKSCQTFYKATAVNKVACHECSC